MASKYIDIPLDLKKGATLLTNEDVVVQRIRLLLTTEPGDFINIPTFGVSMHQYLYESMTEDTADFIKMEIRKAFKLWLDGQVEIYSISVDTDYESHILKVNLELYLVEFNKSVGIVENYKAS